MIIQLLLNSLLTFKGSFSQRTISFRNDSIPSVKVKNINFLKINFLSLIQILFYKLVFHVLNRLSIDLNTEGMSLRAISSNFSIINNTCLPTPTCIPASKYRTMDGSCNNLAIANLGKSGSDYRRVLAPVYNDGMLLLHSTIQTTYSVTPFI